MKKEKRKMKQEKEKLINCEKCHYLVNKEHCQLRMINPSSFNECSKIKHKVKVCGWYYEKK
jgi:hypothetical protein